jgi:dTDP-4-amino-4,6-dideoxygalactose transaminase
MKEIHMVDLKGQYQAIKQEIDSAIASVIENTAFINGPEVKGFQQDLEKFLHAKHVITCGNGTDALQIALMSLGLSPGDEVITSDFTFIATLEVIVLLGYHPVIVDVDPNTFTLDPIALRKAITPKTKAIIPVHLFGQCANMQEIMKISREFGLKIVEDAAQAIGSVYHFSDGQAAAAGTMGDFGTTSFFPSKNLGCYGDGGALYTNDDQLAALARSIANHGMKVRYYHDHVGINSRLDTLQAAILSVKLRHLLHYNESRQAVAHFYDQAFSSCTQIRIPVHQPQSTHIFHQYTIQVDASQRDGLKTHLQSKGIPSMIYYPVPLHTQQAYQYLGYKVGDFPVTEKLCQTVLSLPMHTEMQEDQLHYITDSVLEFFHS